MFEKCLNVENAHVGASFVPASTCYTCAWNQTEYANANDSFDQWTVQQTKR